MPCLTIDGAIVFGVPTLMAERRNTAAARGAPDGGTNPRTVPPSGDKRVLLQSATGGSGDGE